MIKQHGNVVLSPFRLFLEDSKVMYLNNGNIQTCHIWMISLRQKLSDDVVPGGGGYFRNFWLGVCRWDPGTLNLYQS